MLELCERAGLAAAAAISFTRPVAATVSVTTPTSSLSTLRSKALIHPAPLTPQPKRRGRPPKNGGIDHPNG